MPKQLAFQKFKSNSKHTNLPVNLKIEGKIKWLQILNNFKKIVKLQNFGNETKLWIYKARKWEKKYGTYTIEKLLNQETT